MNPLPSRAIASAKLVRAAARVASLRPPVAIHRRLEPNLQLIEFNCVPFVEEMMYDPLGLYRPGPRKAK